MDAAQLVLRLLLAAVFLFMGVTHFVPRIARGMSAMIPHLPHRKLLVRLTGVCELAAAAGLLIPWPWLHEVTGLALVLFLIAVFPANAYAADHPERFGRAATPYWPRYLGQLVLIAAVVVATAPLR
ncbi:MAG TPA: DoxX family protein [Pseudolysinimonas sp.]|nr:DoxX family protein [Pseudolysinimonas sp.]